MSKSVFADNIDKARKSFQPLFGTLEITQKCNLRCKHCYNFDRTKSPEKQNELQELTTQEIYSTLEQLSDLGVLSLNISGGEPLLHPDILPILEKAKEFHFHIRLKSNGTLISKEMAMKLKASGVKEVDISLYGKDEETYRKFSQKEGFQKALSSLIHCKDSGIKVNASVILHRYNVDDLGEMIQILEKEEIFYHISDEITDRYDGTKAREELAVSEEQYIQLLKGPYSYFFNHENSEKNLMCGCAKTVIGIGSTGEVYPCIGSPMPSGNIRNKPLKDIWMKSPTLNRIRALTNEDFKDCQSCNLIEHCSRSSGSAQINTGKYTGCDPVAFTHAKARKSIKENS